MTNALSNITIDANTVKEVAWASAIAGAAAFCGHVYSICSPAGAAMLTMAMYGEKKLLNFVQIGKNSPYLNRIIKVALLVAGFFLSIHLISFAGFPISTINVVKLVLPVGGLAMIWKVVEHLAKAILEPFADPFDAL